MAQIRQHMRTPYPIIIEETTGDESPILFELKNKSGVTVFSIDKDGGQFGGSGGGSGIPTGIIDAKGDLIVGQADNTPIRFPVGADGEVIIADSSQTKGMRWGSPSSALGGIAGGVLSGTYPNPGFATSATKTITIDALVKANGGLATITKAGVIADADITALGVSAALDGTLGTNTLRGQLQVRSGGNWLTFSRFVYFNVLDYGATGGADDTTAFNDTFTAAATVPGGAVIIPSGNYIATILAASGNGLTIFADGANITQKANTNGDLLTLSGVGIKVIGGSWDGNKGATGMGSGNDGISIAANDCAILRAFVTNTKRCGIYAAGVNNARVEGCIVTNTDYISIFSEVTGANLFDFTATNNFVDRSSIAAGSITEGAIKVKGTGTFSYARVRLDGNRVLMPTNPTDGTASCVEMSYCERSTARGNITSGGAMGVSAAACDRVVTSTNSIYNAKNYGIELAGCRYAVCNGNQIDGNALTSFGIILDQGASRNSDYTTISGNTVVGVTVHCVKSQTAIRTNTTGNVFSCPNIYVLTYSAGDGAVVSGNIIDGLGTAQKGILFDSCSDLTITGNTFRDTTQHGVLLYSAQAAYVISEVIVSGNSFHNTGTPVGTQVSGGASVAATVRVAGNIGRRDYLDWNAGLMKDWGTGSPEGVQFGSPGSVWIQTNGAAGTTWWIKESGTGNTGWRSRKTFDGLTITDAFDITIGTTTGTKIGQATSKIGFFNATPIVQPSGTPAVATDLATVITLANDLRTKILALGLAA